MALQMRPPLTSESVGGVFGTACGAEGALGGAGTHCSRGRRLFGAVGCPPGFLCGLFVQSPGRSRIADRLVGGAAEACVSSRRPKCSLAFGSLAFWCALLAKRKPDNRPARRSVSNRISLIQESCNRCSCSSHAAPPRCCRRLHGNTARAASCAWAGACVEINQCAGCTRHFTSSLGDDVRRPGSVER